MQIEIRRMNAEDIAFFHEDIYRLMQICLANSLPDKFEHTFIEEKIIVLKEYLYQNKAYVFGAVNEDSHICGFLWGYILSSEKERLFHIAYFAVDAEVQNRGIGRRLMVAAESCAGDKGISLAELWVSSDNNNAIQFYKNRGYIIEAYRLQKKLASD